METEMEIWNKLKSVPATALKSIGGGRLKGMSDIKPQWRYEKMTETFGMCGFGWKFTVEKQWTESYANGEIAAFANINLFIKVQDVWSDAIPGNGGSMFVANEKNGPYVSDECFKMAITDAIGTAAKMIGLASDVYMGLGGTNVRPQSKYEEIPQNTDITDDKPWLNKGEKLDKAMEYLRNGGKLETIEKNYKISKEIRQSLQTVIDGL
jgi:hypothetical protein